MALNKNSLIADLKAALKTAATANEALDPKAADVRDVAMQNIAEAIAGAVDTYVRTAEVNTKVSAEVDISVAGMPVKQNKDGSGSVVGYGYGSATGQAAGTGKGSLS